MSIRVGNRLGLIALLIASMIGGSAAVSAQDATPAATPDCPTATPVSGAAPEGLVVGYAGLSGEFPFVQDVNHGLERAAACFGVDLIIADNEYDAQKALEVADNLITREVDVAIEFQTDVGVAPTICSRFEEAGIPVIAIDIPHPCAVFFGANNLEAGRIGGENLARIAQERWNGEVDAMVSLELPQSGELPQQRLDGAIEAAQAALPSLTDDKIIRVDSKGSLEGARTVMTDVLTRLADADQILITAINDPAAAGAMRAVEQADRADDVVIAGQNATIEARDEICKGNEAFAGSVAYFPDRYGDKLIPLAIDLANGVEPPEAVYIDHLWIDASNIDQYYPGECG
jgi:ribose transport system substrate-binding protein